VIQTSFPLQHQACFPFIHSVDFEGSEDQPAGKALLAWLEDHFLSSKADEIPRSASPDQLRGGAGSVSGYKFTQNSWLDDEAGAPSRMWGAAWRASPVGTLPPVFLQHNTHSRTVIGMVRRNDGDLNVLMLDPAKHFTSMDLQKPLWQVISCPPMVLICAF